MKNKSISFVVMALTLVMTIVAASCQAVESGSNPYISTEEIAPIKAPFDMPQLQRPVFPNRVFNIKDYGAVADGTTKNTEAFKKAIAACSKAGGGTVLTPTGEWFTGPIHLKSNINLHIAEGATLSFSDDFNDYLPVVLMRWEGTECYNYSPLIYAKDCTNVAITGKGKLVGNGKKWQEWRKKHGAGGGKLRLWRETNHPVKERIVGFEDGLRPTFIEFINCKNVLFEDFYLTDGPFWSVHPVYCENVIARKLNIVTKHSNGDGVNPDSCRNVLIEDCFFNTSDDCVAIKSGRNEDGWRVGKPCENIVVRNCRSVNGGYGDIAIGSEMSGDVRNVYIHDCYFENVYKAFFIKTSPLRGGVVENIWIENITLKNIRGRIGVFTMAYGGYGDRKPFPEKMNPGLFRNFYMKNITCNKVVTSFQIIGLPGKPFENITMDNFDISTNVGLIFKYVKDFKLNNVNINAKQTPAIEIAHGKNVTIENSKCPQGVDTFLRLEGEGTSGIRLINNDVSNAKNKVVFGPEVKCDAVECD